MRSRTRAGLLAGAALLAATSRAQGPEPAAGVDFARDVEPIFQTRCIRCHGPDRQEKGLRLDTWTGALRGGEDGPVIRPGRSADSPLVQRLLGQIEPRMPYEDAPLPPEQVGLIRAWIDAGAPGPDGCAEAPLEGRARPGLSGVPNAGVPSPKSCASLTCGLSSPGFTFILKRTIANSWPSSGRGGGDGDGPKIKSGGKSVVRCIRVKSYSRPLNSMGSPACAPRASPMVETARMNPIAT
jgi:mono/diheme cytochrome c family protein